MKEFKTIISLISPQTSLPTLLSTSRYLGGAASSLSTPGLHKACCPPRRQPYTHFQQSAANKVICFFLSGIVCDPPLDESSIVAATKATRPVGANFLYAMLTPFDCIRKLFLGTVWVCNGDICHLRGEISPSSPPSFPQNVKARDVAEAAHRLVSKPRPYRAPFWAPFNSYFHDISYKKFY